MRVDRLNDCGGDGEVNMKNYIIKYSDMRSGDVIYKTYKGSDLEAVSAKARRIARRRGFLVSVQEAA